MTDLLQPAPHGALTSTTTTVVPAGPTLSPEPAAGTGSPASGAVSNAPPQTTTGYSGNSVGLFPPPPGPGAPQPIPALNPQPTAVVSNATSSPIDAALVSSLSGLPYAPDQLWSKPDWFEAMDPIRTTQDRSIDLTGVGRSDEGETFLVGGQLAVNQSARVTAIRHPQHGEGSEIMLALLPAESKRLEEQLKTDGVAKQPAVIDDAGFDLAQGTSLLGNSTPLAPLQYDATPTKAFRFELPGKYCLEFLGREGVSKAYRDIVRVRVYGASNTERLANLKAALEGPRLTALLEPPSTEYTEKVILQGLLRHRSPQLSDELLERLATTPVEELRTAALAQGLDVARISRARLTEVFPGHNAVVDPGLGQDYLDAGIKGLFVGLREAAAVARILKSDGLMSYTERTNRGTFRPGASNSADERSGGARFAFSRAITAGAYSKPVSIGSSYGAGVAQLLSVGDRLKHVLSRTDWFGYPSDLYGATLTAGEIAAEPALNLSSPGKQGAYSKRLAGKALVDAIDNKGSFSVGNELCFDSGLGNVWTHVVVPTEQAKADLIKLLESVGIPDFNGRPFQEAVLVATQWTAVRDQLAKQGITDW